ncbi:MAG: hypothetical protein IPM45_11240 [Acidimicrobiales bacterium]|nr:hypothetical protein [Acidimicrobiales bacterium]
MTPEETAAATAEAISGLGSHFMLDGATYAKGAALGFEGMNFYVAGRGGVLGHTDGAVVAATFVFFNPDLVVAGWQQGLDVMPPLRSAEEFAGCAHEWARTHLPDGLDYPRLAELAGTVVAAAAPAIAPLFAGWRTLAEPDAGDAKALALHRMNALRELRGAYHGAAVIAAGLTPMEAVVYRQPHMAPLFGWVEPYPDPAALEARWQQADALTNRMMGAALAVLDERERDELAALANAAHDATKG